MQYLWDVVVPSLGSHQARFAFVRIVLDVIRVVDEVNGDHS